MADTAGDAGSTKDTLVLGGTLQFTSSRVEWADQLRESLTTLGGADCMHC